MTEQGHGVPNLDDDALSIFTDGSSLGSPRAGGCAFVLVWCDESGELQTEPVPGGSFAGATNNETGSKSGKYGEAAAGLTDHVVLKPVRGSRSTFSFLLTPW